MIRFAKGHGAGNDFVLIDDPDNARPLSGAQIAALCDRHTGIGADGLLRVVRAAKHPDAVGQSADAEWFMDYYNADGGIAEMCGNGVRVFVRHLLRAGLTDADPVPVATRAGIRVVETTGDELTVDMGPNTRGGSATATVRLRSGEPQVLTGTEASQGNPHLVCRVDDPDDYDLTHPPAVDAATFPDGVNVELISGPPTALRMRVHERGVGETQACGTGACAAAAVALDGAGRSTVDLPGGRLTIDVTADSVRMTGPAVLVAHGETDLV